MGNDEVAIGTSLSMQTQADKRCRADAASRHLNCNFATKRASCSWPLEKDWNTVCTCGWGWCGLQRVEGRRIQPTLKRSACRTVFRVCGKQVMVAGRSRTLTEVYLSKFGMRSFTVKSLLLLSGPWGARVSQDSLFWMGGWEYGWKRVVKNHKSCSMQKVDM